MDSSGSPSGHGARLREALDIAETGRIPEQPARLTRRKRHLVVAADRWENYATVWFLRRGHSGEPVNETLRLHFDGTEWSYTGSGGGGVTDLESRPSLVEVAAHYAGWHPNTAHDQISFAIWVGEGSGPGRAAVEFQAATEAATLHFSDRDPRPIAQHGYCLVTYSPQRPPTITAVSGDGSKLGSFQPRRRRRWLNEWPFFERFFSHGVVGQNRRLRWGTRPSTFCQ